MVETASAHARESSKGACCVQRGSAATLFYPVADVGELTRGLLHRRCIVALAHLHVVRFLRMPPRKVTRGQSRLTRAQVAERLGVCKSTVRNLEGVELFPLVGDRGVRYFDSSRVEELATRMNGEAWVYLELDPEKHMRARALCIEMGTNLSAWLREQIEKRLLAG